MPHLKRMKAERPLSLVEALKGAPFPGAAVSAAMALVAASAAAPAQGATPTLEGRWIMAPAQSSFREDLTGPAPDTASMIVSRDDGRRLSYQLIESLNGAEVARGAYDLSLSGDASSASVDGRQRQVSVVRDANGEVVVRSPSRRGAQVVIRLKRTGSDTATIEHDLETAQGSVVLEKIALVRSGAVPVSTTGHALK